MGGIWRWVWNRLIDMLARELRATLAHSRPEVALAWGKRVSPEFRAKVIEISRRLALDPSTLMAIIAFETGRTFSAKTINRRSSATGLIQFMPSTARTLGTTTSKLASMTELQQLAYVERYLRPYSGRLSDLASAYMAVLWPAAVRKPLSHVLFASPSLAYDQNRGLDTDKDGKITKAEAAAKVQRLLLEGMRPENFG